MLPGFLDRENVAVLILLTLSGCWLQTMSRQKTIVKNIVQKSKQYPSNLYPIPKVKILNYLDSPKTNTTIPKTTAFFETAATVQRISENTPEAEVRLEVQGSKVGESSASDDIQAYKKAQLLFKNINPKFPSYSPTEKGYKLSPIKTMNSYSLGPLPTDISEQRYGLPLCPVYSAEPSLIYTKQKPYYLYPKSEHYKTVFEWLGANGTMRLVNDKLMSNDKKAKIKEFMTDNTTRSEVNEMYKNGISYGGHYKPENCQARSRVAFIIAYRSNETQVDGGREQMTTRFLKHMLPWLKSQKIEFKIYLICQGWEDFNFNRARLLSIGFLEAEKDGPWDCYTTHDIDRLPLNPNISYHCPPHGKAYHHTTFGGDFGGVGSMTGPTFRAINGFSNMFFGWGGEDQDMGWRLDRSQRSANIQIDKILEEEGEKNSTFKKLLRQGAQFKKQYKLMNPFDKWGPTTSASIVSYIHIHQGRVDVGNGQSQFKGRLIGNFTDRWNFDGLHTLRYKVDKIVEQPLFTKIYVDFHRSWGLENRHELDPATLVRSHPCLQSFEKLVACGKRIWDADWMDQIWSRQI